MLEAVGILPFPVAPLTLIVGLARWVLEMIDRLTSSLRLVKYWILLIE